MRFLERRRGPLGKATLPVKSPFESRNTGLENLEWEVGRPPKPTADRESRDHQASNSPGVQINTANGTELLMWARTADSAKLKPKAPPVRQRQQQRAHEVIEIDDDEPPEERFLQGFSSDALQRPSSPPSSRYTCTRKAIRRFQFAGLPNNGQVTTGARSLSCHNNETVGALGSCCRHSTKEVVRTFDKG